MISKIIYNLFSMNFIPKNVQTSKVNSSSTIVLGLILTPIGGLVLGQLQCHCPGELLANGS